jgi:hypothetical protein
LSATITGIHREIKHSKDETQAMALYDYHCKANQKTIEVSHPMSETLKTWGELCEKADIDPGKTPLDSPVTRLITGGLTNTYNEPMKLGSILPKH